ncbi:MAG TPA: class I SAM-dependent methyltransferase, partial [Pirellulaceae bacterium]|nr:class I SAM-dependent methyltransferase [Pirellulaceae bacterium]
MTTLAVHPPQVQPTAACPAEILRCPITHGPLRELTPEELDGINTRIERGTIRHVDGSPVAQTLDAGYIGIGGEFAYGVRDRIALLVPALAIQLASASNQNKTDRLRSEKQAVQRYYDDIGWSTGAGGKAFVDAQNWEDLRAVAQDYIRACHRRVKRHLRPTGKYLLDVASGPVQYPEYLEYSERYAVRICVDISFAALREARRKLGDRGIFILGDITNLPLAEGIADGVVSLHTIYHTPADEQATAFREIYRVLAPGCTAAVVYCWRSALIKAVMLPAKLVRGPWKLA